MPGWISNKLADWTPSAPGGPVEPIVRTAGAPAVLSFTQEASWLSEQGRPGQVSQAIPGVACRLLGDLDVTALSRAFGAVADRHELLRSRFDLARGQPRMSTDPPGAVELELIDLANDDDPWRASADQVNQAAERGFDVAGGRLALARLYRLGPDDHVLTISAHDSVLDNNSVSILVAELSASYQAYAAGSAPDLPELAIQYQDYASWQQATLGVTALSRQLEFWRGKLAGADMALRLPADKPRPAAAPYRAARVPWQLTDAATIRLRELARASGASVWAITLAAYLGLLSRYGRTLDVTVSCASPGRPSRQLAGLIGPFGKTLPIRADLAGRPTFAELIGQVSRLADEALAHQDLPLAQFMHELQPATEKIGSQSHGAFFASYVPGAQLRLGSASIEPLAINPSDTFFDVELHLIDDHVGALSGEIVYAQDVVDRGAIHLVAGHYANFLISAVAEPGNWVAAINVAGLAELGRIRPPSAVSADRPEFSGLHGESLSELFEERANRAPAAIAVRCGSRQLSYAQLNASASRLAWALLDRGAGPEQVIAVLLERGIDLIVALLGIAKTGSAYLPLDPGYPPERIAFMLGDAGVCLTITQSRIRAKLPGDAAVVVVDDPGKGLAARPPGTAPHSARPANLAYVIYTSGSTGRPKGVAVETRALLNLVSWHIGTYRLGEGDVVSQVASPAFDAAGWEIWPALIAGSCLDIVPAEAVGVAERMTAHFAAAGTSVAFVPTPLAMLLVREPLGVLTRLRLLLTGGDVLQPRPDDNPGVPVLNHYGPTEATVVATASGPLGPPWRRPPIGAPIANVAAYVLTDALAPAGIGIPGELYLGGAGIGRGYVGRPGLTAERFLPDPFSAAPGARMYRTGDIARWREDASLEFIGRADEQVKIRGHRIEPGEIEAALVTHHAITQAAVVAAQHPGGGQLVAYVVASGAELDRSAVRAHLSRQLPAYLLPSAFIELDRLPLSPSGKIDRKLLPAFAPAPTEDDLPRDNIERAITRIASNLLGLQQIGVNDDFFELGGHSLLALQLIARIRDQMGVDVPIHVIFDRRSVAGISKAVLAARRPE